MLAEMFGRPLGIEAFEDRFEIVLGNARSLGVDADDGRPAARLTAELAHDLRARRTEGDRVVDDVAKHLAVASVMTMRHEWRVGRQPILDLDPALLHRRRR